MYASRASKLGASDHDVDVFVVEALFTTVTNVNFDPMRLYSLLTKAASVRDAAKALYEKACANAGTTPEQLTGPALWQPAGDLDGLVEQGEAVGIEGRIEARGDDFTGLQELATYGIKGSAAYVEHARVLGVEDAKVYADIHDSMNLLTKDDATVDELTGACLAVGAINFRAMELLDQANTDAYGHPVPTQVRVTPVAGKAILVSGHDLKDLEELLKQTEGKDINVYTHGEMLPAHGYPTLKAYKHLVGNYGGAWMNQAVEFSAFPGAILMTTNCIQRPLDRYKWRLYTSGLVAWPGVTHISDGDFTPVIEAALSSPGFAADETEKLITVGFGHNAVLGVADKVIAAVKNGDIRHFFLVGGCDGSKPGRNYFTQFAEMVPKDSVILTLACGKYRFNKLEFGDIGGIPRLLDIGQCNDAFSAVKIALALADAFECGVNDLPLSLIISWYEQKAVAILLTLLNLGVKNIRLGPSLPAFVTPKVLKVLVDKFSIAPITTPSEDLKLILSTT